MVFGLPIGPSVSTIDLSQCASIMNRRFYRQGLNWAVAGFRIISASGMTGPVTITKLPNSWVLANSWKKSLAVWTRMNNEALAESPTVRPRFLDFKIYADREHHVNGYANNLLPISGLGIQATPGEWESAKIFHPIGVGAVEGQTAEAEVIAVGASYQGPGASGLEAVSMIEGYAASRLLPNVLDPNTPGDADDTDNFTPENWMAAVFNEGTEQVHDVLLELTTENNIAPYPFENDGVHFDTMYPGGANQLTGLEYHDSAYISPTTIGGTTSIRGSNFPCGLIQINSNLIADPVGTALLQVHLIPGKHRGYLCESMQEM
jgi:hypothetical protein